jgi:hypothetical protein
MTYLHSISQSINYVRPVMPCTVVETTMAGAVVISGLYSAAIGGAIGVGYLSYKGYQYLHSKEGVGGEAVDGKIPKKEKKTFENGDTYEGEFVEDKRHGIGKFTFTTGDVYEGEFVEDKRHGKGKFTSTAGDVYEGAFIEDIRHGKGKYTFSNGDCYEGDFVENKFWGRGKYTLADGDCYEGEFFNDAVISSGISNLCDQLFYNLLNRPMRTKGAMRGYNLGIMSDYLQKNGYQDLGSALSSAHQLLRISPNDMKQESEKIHGALTRGLSQLFLYGCERHSMGLHLVPDPSSGSVLCEIFNSGEGLQYHEHHDGDSRKYKTMLQIKVPMESLNPEKIKTILLCDDFKNVDEAYRHIFDLFFRPEIIRSETAPWQTVQKSGECDLRWILVYLKNKMPEEKYKKMLSTLRVDCQIAYEAKNHQTCKADFIGGALQRKRKR